jgi:hypothetical protein
MFRWAGSYEYSEEVRKFVEQNHPGPGRGTILVRTVLEGRVVQIIDVLSDPEYNWPEVVTLEEFVSLATPKKGDTSDSGCE